MNNDFFFYNLVKKLEIKLNINYFCDNQTTENVINFLPIYTIFKLETLETSQMEFN